MSVKLHIFTTENYRVQLPMIRFSCVSISCRSRHSVHCKTLRGGWHHLDFRNNFMILDYNNYYGIWNLNCMHAHNNSRVFKHTKKSLESNIWMSIIIYFISINNILYLVTTSLAYFGHCSTIDFDCQLVCRDIAFVHGSCMIALWWYKAIINSGKKNFLL